jgi:hypothetical protein
LPLARVSSWAFNLYDDKALFLLQVSVCRQIGDIVPTVTLEQLFTSYTVYGCCSGWITRDALKPPAIPVSDSSEEDSNGSIANSD